ncbi:MAG: M16 family metallopeptidase, partial [bacterium]
MTTYEYFGSAQRFTLENEFTVILKPVEQAKSVSTQLWVEAGSLYEDETNNGLSHFLEHMLFKGTSNYSGAELNRRVESVGDRLNAGTSKDYTNYHVTLPSQHWERGLEILREMGFRAQLPLEEFNKERDVVLSELARYRDNPERLIRLRFAPLLYDGHPYHRSTIGKKDVLQSVSHSQLRDYYEHFYGPSRMSLVVTGDFSMELAKSRIIDFFRDEPNKIRPYADIPEVTPPETTSIQSEPAPVNQSYGLVGTTGVSMSSNRSLALDCLMELLGKGRDSRLHERLVLDEELVSTVSSSFWTQKYAGPVRITFRTEHDTQTVLEAIRSTINDVVEEGISEDELQRAKTSLKSDFVYRAQTSRGQARQLGYWHTIGDL